jgi:UPF0042 nucleotide-binding protein
MQLFLISGLSGSGKSVALKVLEDSGYYCVDNLPAELLPTLINSLQNSGCQRAAASVDVRSSGGVEMLPTLIERLKREGVIVQLLFLDAHTDTLVKRFSETRRRHPLSDSGLTLPECIQQERALLEPIAGIGHRIDSTELAPNALRNWVKQFMELDRARLTLLFQSFGFKHGLPLDADFVFDVRCLPNPFYDPRLRPYTGRDREVIEFLERTPSVGLMVGDIRNFIERWLPAFVADNRSYLTVAIGCTGGQHRSVYISEQLGQYFSQHQQQVLVRHRELNA